MRSGENQRPVGRFLHSGVQRIRPAGAAVGAPDLGLVLAIDGQCVVSRVPPVVPADLPVRVFAAPRIDHDSLSTERQLEAQGVAVGMPRLVIGPDRSAVDDQPVPSLRRHDVVARLGKGPAPPAGR